MSKQKAPTFKLEQPDSIWWPVIVNAPADHGESNEGTFEVRFRYLSDPEFEAIDKSDNRAYLREVVEDWQPFPGPDGELFEFSEENLDLMLLHGYIRIAMVRAHQEMQVGARRKN